jgi:asparagine synthase (glutamine-hydrolysing)
MIPPPSLKDGTDVHERYNVISSGQSIGLGGGTYYGYIDNLKRTVEKNFNTCNLELERILYTCRRTFSTYSKN